MPYNDPVVGGTTLIRPAIKSRTYVPGVSGWSINRDGSAEFNNVTVRGDLIVRSGNNEIFVGVQTTPIILFNPDTTLYSSGSIQAVGIDANTSQLELSSPSSLSSGFQSGITLISGTTLGNPEIAFAAGVVRATHYLFEQLATEQTAIANSAAVTPGNVLDVVTVGVTSIKAACTFEIKANWHGVGFVTPVAFPGNVLTMRLTRDGTQIVSCRILGQNTTLTQFGGELTKTDTPGAGFHTYALSILHEAGSTAASVHTVATANSPTTISLRGFSST